LNIYIWVVKLYPGCDFQAPLSILDSKQENHFVF